MFEHECSSCGRVTRDAYRCEVCGENPYRGPSGAGLGDGPGEGWLTPRRKVPKDPNAPWGFWKNLGFMLTAPFLAWGYVMFILPIQCIVMLLWPDGKLATQEAEAIRRREERERNMSDHDLLVSIARSTGSPSKR